MTTTPRWFAGQRNGSGETLVDLGPVAPGSIGSSAQLTLIRNENTSDPANDGRDFASLNGVPHHEFELGSPNDMVATALGEVDHSCQPAQRHARVGPSGGLGLRSRLRRRPVGTPRS